MKNVGKFCIFKLKGNHSPVRYVNIDIFYHLIWSFLAGLLDTLSRSHRYLTYSVFLEQLFHNLQRLLITDISCLIVFTEGCNIKNGRAGVYVTMSPEGRPSGEAYVELETEEDLENACKKDKEHMGPRYIEGIEIDTFLSPEFRDMNSPSVELTLKMSTQARHVGNFCQILM